MEPDVTSVPEETASRKKLVIPAMFKKLAIPPIFKKLAIPPIFKKLAIPPIFKKLPIPAIFTKLPVPPIVKKFMIPGIAALVLLIVGGVSFGLMHARAKPALAQAKGAPAASATTAATAATAASTACSGVVRDLYRQSLDDDPSVTLAEVRAEVASSGVGCAPDPTLAADLKDLSPACRDMVQYTFLSVREGHADLTVLDVKPKVVLKSIACEHDRLPSVASVPRSQAKK